MSNKTKNYNGINYNEYKKIRIQVLVKQNFACNSCKIELLHNEISYELHHRNCNPKDNRFCNVEILCLHCHRVGKHKHNIWYRY